MQCHNKPALHFTPQKWKIILQKALEFDAQKILI